MPDLHLYRAAMTTAEWMEALMELVVNRMVWTIHRLWASAHHRVRSRGYLNLLEDLPEPNKQTILFVLRECDHDG